MNPLTFLACARRGLCTYLLGVALLLGGSAGLAAAAPAVAGPAADDGARPLTGHWTHAFAAYGAPKYGPDFDHFEYVNPAAPRGGTLRLRNPDRRTSFDKYNPFTTRGNAPAGVLIWMFEGLAHLSADEPSTMYGLLAEAMWVAPDFSAVSFRLRPGVKFSNGDAITPADVQHSFAMLSGKGAAPSYQTLLAGIARVEAVDARTVRFELREKTRDQVFLAGTVPIFSRKWGEGKPLDQIVTEPPIAAGPYIIAKAEMPRRIEFARNPHYWASGLPVRRGHFNFDRIVYRNYTDQAVSREAFKAGEFEIFKEYGARSWVRQHKGVKWDDGRIVKRGFVTAYGQLMQAYMINMRRPLFQDARVREALIYTYDFENLNKTGLFKRANSLFSNSEFAAEGLPGPGELRLLEPFRAELPPRVFGPAYAAPRTDTSPTALRTNLLKARDLLEQAGWKLDGEGTLRNAKGEPFEIEYLTPREAGDVAWQGLLKKLGITLKDRVVDFALYRTRLEKYDYDMITIAGGDFTLPDASTLAAILGSKSADEPGNSNFRGVKSKAVDALIEAIGHAQSTEALRDACRALDRVVTWGFFQIPDLYLNVENVSFWNRFGIPEVQAKYFNADTYFTGIGEFGPWPLWTWWDKSLEGKR
ncbi:MAG: extracellular solute-binding protein [Burkholderiaceae bacterium]|nr:extracellular solute-binding protein [Burkholderiaceae bacterium]